MQQDRRTTRAPAFINITAASTLASSPGDAHGEYGSCIVPMSHYELAWARRRRTDVRSTVVGASEAQDGPKDLVQTPGVQQPRLRRAEPDLVFARLGDPRRTSLPTGDRQEGAACSRWAK
jgi:hypothetical protein